MLLNIKGISKTFYPGKENEVKALQPTSLEIQKGEFVIIVGANGSGKSSFFNLLQGRLSLSSGSIQLNGRDISHMPLHQRCRYISTVFQDPAKGTAGDLTVLENFRLAAVRKKSKQLLIGNNGRFREEVSRRIAALEMGLENKLDQAMNSLSGGQRQALSLLMSTMDDSSLLLMDEPTAALDPKSAKLILTMADKLNREKGLTILMITHSIKDALQYGDRLLQFHEGRISKDLPSNQKKALSLNDIYSWFE